MARRATAVFDMVFCDDCNDCYHVNCHEPPLTAVPMGRWSCSTCAQKPVGCAGGGFGGGAEALQRAGGPGADLDTITTGNRVWARLGRV